MLFDTLKDRSLTDTACFLCGVELSDANRSDEHVIPRWAQERFDLWDQRLVLLNQTSIPYRQLTIPCCWECNNGALQPLENAIARATLAGPQAVRALDRTVLFTWLGKIFYGLLHRELFLLLNRQVPDDGTITSPELLMHYSLHHLFLQNVRVAMEFHGEFPASIFVYETKTPPNPKFQWDFRDNLQSLFISVRVGRVGVVAALQDGGAQETLRPEIEKNFGIPLHPLQHLEVTAMVGYKTLLATRTPTYLVIDGQPVRVVQLPLAGLSTKPFFENWEPPMYARVLAECTHLPPATLLSPDNRVMTWLRDPEEKLRDLDLEVYPWPPLKEDEPA